MNNNLTNLKNLINSVVSKLYRYAQDNYANLSSFAIVTCEGYECFDVAINTDTYFSDLLTGKTCDEVYWNTAEWLVEILDPKPIDKNINAIYNLLNEMDSKDRAAYFLPICLEVLVSIRQASNDKKNGDICLFVHMTDHGFDNDLYEVVKALNPEPVAQSYKEYHDWEYSHRH